MDKYLYLVINDDKWEKIPNTLVDVVPYLKVEPRDPGYTLKIWALPRSKFPTGGDLWSVLPEKKGPSKQVGYCDAYQDIKKFFGLFGTGWFDLVVGDQKIDCTKEWNWDLVDFNTLSPKQLETLLNIESSSSNMLFT